MPCDRCCTCDDCVAARDEESRIFDEQLADEFAALEAEVRDVGLDEFLRAGEVAGLWPGGES